MDKNDFLGLLNRYTETSAEEAAEIASLKAEYPYSQLLQTLSARVSKDHAFEEHQQELARAAVLSADRAVLKEIITAGGRTAPTGKLTPETLAIVTPLPAKEAEVTGDDAVIDYADEVMRDLKKLNDLKTNFEMLLVEYSEVKASSGVQAKPAIIEEPKSDQQSASAVPPGEKGKSKKQRIIELAQRLKNENSAAPDEGRSGGKKTGAHSPRRQAQYPEGLIEEIKTSKKELKPESEKQKEQINIINNFIKTQPSISNSKEKTILPPGDLNPVRSGEFGDNIVSETLVEILVKQGKKDKAIEVLKKLIWKYPQKKSYFASQIEDLKK